MYLALLFVCSCSVHSWMSFGNPQLQGLNCKAFALHARFLSCCTFPHPIGACKCTPAKCFSHSTELHAEQCSLSLSRKREREREMYSDVMPRAFTSVPLWAASPRRPAVFLRCIRRSAHSTQWTSRSRVIQSHYVQMKCTGVNSSALYRSAAPRPRARWGCPKARSRFGESCS